MIKHSELINFQQDLDLLEKMTKPRDLFRLANARRMALEQQPKRLLNFYLILAAISTCFFTGFLLIPIDSISPIEVDNKAVNVESQISPNHEIVMTNDTDFYYWLDIYDE